MFRYVAPHKARRQSVRIQIAWARSMQILFEKLRDIVRSSGTAEPLGDLHSTLLSMQSQYFTAMADPPRAVEIARQALQLLDQQMPSYPQDHYLQMLRGYFVKNEAMSLRDLGDAAGFDRSLAAADRVFQTIRAEAELYLSNAYNGFGSVTLLQAAAQRSKRQGSRPCSGSTRRWRWCRIIPMRCMTARRR